MTPHRGASFPSLRLQAIFFPSLTQKQGSPSESPAGPSEPTATPGRLRTRSSSAQQSGSGCHHRYMALFDSTQSRNGCKAGSLRSALSWGPRRPETPLTGDPEKSIHEEGCYPTGVVSAFPDPSGAKLGGGALCSFVCLAGWN